MLSAAEMKTVYGGTPGQAAHPAGSLVDMPSDDATAELNPQSLSFDEISVGHHQPETPATKGGARGESASTPFMADDGAGSAARASAAAPLGGAIGSGGDPASASHRPSAWRSSRASSLSVPGSPAPPPALNRSGC